MEQCACDRQGQLQDNPGDEEQHGEGDEEVHE
jgi:hypothetical protein